MTNKAKIIFVACVWLVIAVVMVVINEKLFINGETIKLEVLPLNRILLKEQSHIALNFKISKIDVDNPLSVSTGQRVFAVLTKGKEDIYEVKKLETRRPKKLKTGEILLRGNVIHIYSNPQTKKGYVDVNFGIDTYFTPMKEIENVKQALINGGVAEVKVSKWGSAKVVGFVD